MTMCSQDTVQQKSEYKAGQRSVTALRTCSRAQVYAVTRTHTTTYTGQHTVL